MTQVKICGLRDRAMIDTAVDAGAAMVGFVHFAPSPRHVEFGEMAELIVHARGRAKTVVVTVNPSDEDILKISHMNPDFLQIHKLPDIARLNQIKMLTHVPLIVALAIQQVADVETAKNWASVHDWLLFDAKAPETSPLPGGNGVSFDWSLLRGLSLPKHAQWLLSGGLTPENVAEALRITGAKWVDVSSGVEYHAGSKNPDAIRQFIENTKCL